MNKKQAALLEKIKLAGSLNEALFVDADSRDVKVLLEEGVIQVNRSVTDAAGNVAVRVTPESERVAHAESATQNAAPAAQLQKVQNMSQFRIANVVAPSVAPRGTATYPFDVLEVNQAFFVPATEDRPNPAKSLASTVTSANERHSEVIEGQTRTNRRGNEVPATRQLRQFVIRALDDGGSVFGEEFAGVKGAAIYRVL